jgi:metal-responsive CopG/Arc/MetJ family transcriptional regulator
MEDKRGRGRPRTVIKLHKRTVSLPPSLYERLEEIAVAEERNVNDLIVHVLRKFVRDHDAGVDTGNGRPEALAA